MSAIVYLRMLGYVAGIALHVGNLGHVLWTYDIKNHEDANIRRFGKLEYYYFTNWNLGVQILYGIIGLVCDTLTLSNKSTKNYKLPKSLQGTRDTIFAGILFPSTLLVFGIFWPLFLYDRNLILPAFVDKIISRTSNHILHTVIVPLVIWETIFQPRQVPKSHKRYLTHWTLWLVVYFIAIIYKFNETGLWPYPIMTILYGTIKFPIFILSVAALGLSVYFPQWWITRLVWGKHDFKKSMRKVR